MKTTGTIDVVITEIYKSAKKIKPKINSGFASVSQKNNLVSLKVLYNATIFTRAQTSISIQEGQFILVKEELLHTQKHLLQQFQINEEGVNFMLIPSDYIVGIQEDK